MSKSLESAVTSYLKARSLSPATGVEYRSTLSKWKEWKKEISIESMVQQTMIEANGGMNDFRSEADGEFGVWLRLTMARNLADEVRKHGRELLTGACKVSFTLELYCVILWCIHKRM